VLPITCNPSRATHQIPPEQERHLLVKVIDRILYKLDDLVRPFVHKILVVIEPLLIDEDYYARVEGREIISNLAKAAGGSYEEFGENCAFLFYELVSTGYSKIFFRFRLIHSDCTYEIFTSCENICLFLSLSFDNRLRP
jgi:hypothetical protein